MGFFNLADNVIIIKDVITMKEYELKILWEKEEKIILFRRE